MSDLGVLVPIIAPSGFGTRQAAASNTASSGERIGAPATPSAATNARTGASPGVTGQVDPLTGLARPTGLSASLVAVLQEIEERTAGEPGEEPAAGDGEDEGGAASASAAPQTGAATPGNLTPEQQQLVQELERTDAEVRRHEQAHAAAGGPFAGAPSYDYTRGPDGRLYAIGGDVQIDVAAIPGNPEATIRKMQVVRRAALAPASPSPQDQRVAAIAQQRITEARQEQRELELEEQQEAAAERREAEERAQRLQPGSSANVAQQSGIPVAGRSPSPTAAAAAGAVFDIIA